MKEVRLSDKLLLGSATAATQIEGGDINCNWYQWSLDGNIANGESSITAADHWNRFREDIEIMSSLNQQTYRMSIEWSRIEPERDVWSKEGITHYREELTLLRKKNILPLLTLHHFSCPQWLQEEGAWVKPETVIRFLIFVRKVVEELGDLVSDFCTINEPNVFVNDTYMDGKYPPGAHNDVRSYFKAASNLTLAHIEVYRLIHHIRSEKGFPGKTKVGFVHHLAWFVTQGFNPLTRLSRAFQNYSFHTLFFRGMVEGKYPFPFRKPRIFNTDRGALVSQGILSPVFYEQENGGFFSDFIGINYYSRHIIKASKNPATLFGQASFEKGLPEEKYNDLGWEIYPEGLGFLVRKTWKRYRLPIYITENGIPDSNDTKRGNFIKEHLKIIQELIDEDIPVERYYYWSLLDNLEWDDGYGPRFGLVEVDYTTQQRRIRESGKMYGKICKSREL